MKDDPKKPIILTLTYNDAWLYRADLDLAIAALEKSRFSSMIKSLEELRDDIEKQMNITEQEISQKA